MRTRSTELLLAFGRAVLAALAVAAGASGMGACNAIAGIHEGILAPCAGCDDGGAGGARAAGGGERGGEGGGAAGSRSTGATMSASGAACGDGIIDSGEECDDHNAAPYDGCTSCVVDCDEPSSFKDPVSHHCYRLLEINVTFAQALFACGQMSAYLAAVTSADELALIAEHLPAATWIGANDLAVQGSFVWVNGEPWSFAPWKLGDPSAPSKHRDCVALTGSPPVFDDDDCLATRPFLCERSPAGIHP